MGQARRPEADLRQLEAVADLHQPVLVGDLHVLEHELAMAAMFFGPHDRDAAQDAPQISQMRNAVGRAGIVRGVRHQMKRVAARTGDEPLSR
jgi:hypothetical protein